MNATSDVLSCPLGSGGSPGRLTMTNRVTASGLSSTSVASTSRRYRSAAMGAAMAASWLALPSASPAAAAAVESAGTTVASGSAVASQRRHCAAACGWVATRRTWCRPVPGRAISANDTGSSTSRVTIRRSPTASSSRVAETEPSTEFSIGTRAWSASPRRTASSAAVTLTCGCRSPFAAAGRVRSAASAKVPSGPR